MLEVQNLTAQFEDTPILKGVNLTVRPGELHILLGPNGSGKSTLGKVLLAHPHYQKTGGTMKFCGQDLDELETFERARLGIFLAHQSPPTVTGVPAKDLLRAAEKAIRSENVRGRNILDFKKDITSHLEQVRLRPEFMNRHWNEGASGGERRKMEIVSLLTLGAKLAFLDEVDSGVDVDALHAIAKGVKEFLANKKNSVVLVTHLDKILNLLDPTHIHIFHDGKIVLSGGKEVAEKIHSEGFKEFLAV